MRTTAIAGGTAALAGALLLATSAGAAPPGKCEFSRLKSAAKYSRCLLDASARTLKRDGDSADSGSCDARLSSRWRRAEGKGMGQCPASDDEATQAFLQQCADGLATGLAGNPLPACGGSPGGAHLGSRAVLAAFGGVSVPETPYRRVVLLLPPPGEREGGQDRRRHAGLRHVRREVRRQVGSRGGDRCRPVPVERRPGCDPGIHHQVHRWRRCRPRRWLTPGVLGAGRVASPEPRRAEQPNESGRDPHLSRQRRTACDPVACRWALGGHRHARGGGRCGVLRRLERVFHARRTSDGTEIWSRQLGSAVRPSALVAGERVYAAESNGKLTAMRRDTGEVVWAAALDTQPLLSIDSSPVLAGNTIVIGVASFEQGIRKADYTFRGNVVGLDADTGQERWRVYTSENDATSGAGVSVWSTAAVDEARKLVFIGTGQSYEQPAGPRSDSLLAIHYDTGEVAWVHQFTPNDVFTIAGGGPGPDADVGASPNLFSIGTRDVVGVGQKNGFYHVLDRATGDTVWEVQLTGGGPLGGVMVTAAVHDGVVYVNSNKWVVYGIFRGVNSRPDTSATFALDARDGTILWQRPMPAPMFGAMSSANGVVYQGTIDGTAHALSAADGTELWSDQPGGGIAGGFSIVGGTLYVGHGFWFFSPPASPDGGFVAYSLSQEH